MKDSTLATVLNIIPGLGYVYIGGEKKNFGLTLLTGSVIIFISGFDPKLSTEEYMNTPGGVWDALAFLGVALIVGAIMYDGYQSCIRHNAAISKKK